METSLLDQVQEYWDRRPCNIRHSDADFGTRQYFDEVRWRKYFVEPHIPGFAQVARWKGKRVLEVGCGIGTDTIEFARSGAEVTAVELSQVSLSIAQRRAALYGPRGRIQFVWDDAQSMDFVPWAGYDLVYSFGVLHHVPYPGQALWAMRERMAPDGEMRIMLYHRRSWKVLRLLLRYWRRGMTVDQAVARQSEAQGGCPVTHTYTKRMARRLLELNGLKVVSIEIAHIFPYRWRDYVQYRYVKAFPWKIVPAPLFRWLERRLGWHMLIVARRI